MLPRILARFWSASLKAEMEYRLNFVTATLNTLGYVAGTIFTLSVMSRGGRALGGWPLDEALIVVAFFTLLTGVTDTILSPNLSKIVMHAQNGTLDFVLLLPLDAQLYLSLRHFSPFGIPSLLAGLGLLIYQGVKLNLPWSAYLIGIVPVTLAILILYSIWFLVATTTIWFTKVWNATEVLRSFLGAGQFPISAYPPAYQFFFRFILPVAFLTTVPAEAMLGRAAATKWLFAECAVAAILFLAARLFWRWALRSYSSASS